MSASKYISSFVQSSPILFGGVVPTQMGVLLSEYTVQEYWDLRQSSGTTGEGFQRAKRAYVVALKQKISIFNNSANSFNALNAVTGYDGYPILLVQQITPILTNEQQLTYYLDDYHPKTLNASISTSANAATNSDTANSIQRSSGSSFSVTNSYEISDNVGFMGPAATGGVSATLGHSETNTVESSASTGRSETQGNQSGTSSAMTIKDWASFAFLDQGRQQPSWVWGQEYPWNVVDFRSVGSEKNDVELPSYVQKRLFDGSTIFPPSELSQFGLDFTAHAKWTFIVDDPVSSGDEIVSFRHSATYWEGAHGTNSGAAFATLTVIAVEKEVETLTLNLPVLALEPIREEGAQNGAVLGFVKSEFFSPPSGSVTPFRLKSSANNIYASGSGFDALGTVDSVLSAGKISEALPASLFLQFKVISETIELTLFLKHWKLGSAGCIVTLAINEVDPSNPISPIIRHVDTLKDGGGGDNVTSIMLRKKDYMSDDFYDYLVVGLNTISITVTPADGQTQCGYALRAVAIS